MKEVVDNDWQPLDAPELSQFFLPIFNQPLEQELHRLHTFGEGGIVEDKSSEIRNNFGIDVLENGFQVELGIAFVGFFSAPIDVVSRS